MRTLGYIYKNTGKQSNAVLKSKEKIVDAIFCLMAAASDGELTSAGPDRITILPDGTVTIANPGEQDLYYAAPEVVLGETGENEEAAWFTLGLLAAYVLTGKNFYQEKGLDLVSMKEMREKGDCLVALSEEDLSTNNDVMRNLANAIRKFTAWNPKERQNGAGDVLSAVKKCLTVADIKYYMDDKPVFSEMMKITQPKHIISAGTSVSGRDGKEYVVAETLTIPMRAGKHSYRVIVKEK